MVTTDKLTAAKKFCPGYFIKEQLELRKWTVKDLADAMTISASEVEKIISHDQQFTPETAKLLGKIFHTSQQYWMNIDTGYRLWLKQSKTCARN